jgi:hypothetical protein
LLIFKASSVASEESGQRVLCKAALESIPVSMAVKAWDHPRRAEAKATNFMMVVFVISRNKSTSKSEKDELDIL